MTHPVITHLHHLDVHALRHLLDDAPGWVASVNGVNSPGGKYLADVRETLADELAEHLGEHVGDGLMLKRTWEKVQARYAELDKYNGRNWYLDSVMPMQRDRYETFQSLELGSWRTLADRVMDEDRFVVADKVMAEALRDVAFTLMRALIAHAEAADLENPEEEEE